MKALMVVASLLILGLQLGCSPAVTASESLEPWEADIRTRAGMRVPHNTEAGSTRQITDASWFECLDRAKFDELNGYLADQDRVAFIRSAGRACRDSDCKPFKQGEEVLLENTAIFSGLVRVR